MDPGLKIAGMTIVFSLDFCNTRNRLGDFGSQISTLKSLITLIIEQRK